MKLTCEGCNQSVKFYADFCENCGTSIIYTQDKQIDRILEEFGFIKYQEKSLFKKKKEKYVYGLISAVKESEYASTRTLYFKKSIIGYFACFGNKKSVINSLNDKLKDVMEENNQYMKIENRNNKLKKILK